MSIHQHADPRADAPAALLTVVDRDARRALVTGAEESKPTGIDFVEVVPMAQTLSVLGLNRPPRWRMLLVHLLRGPVPQHWDADRVAIFGGVRADPAVNPVEVAWAAPALAITGPDGGPVPALPPGLTPADRTLVQAVVAVDRRDRVLVVRTTSWGDLSGYVLRIVAGDGDSLPPELDPPLAQERFSFAVDCPATLDCRRPDRRQAVPGSQPVLDYLARDYPALRRRLLDRLATLIPGWKDTIGADIGVTLVELMAHLGDLYAYRQDAAAQEAYLTTARMRTSVRRHARLLGYPMGDGCSARTWLAFEVPENLRSRSLRVRGQAAVCDGGTIPAPVDQRRTPLGALDAGATVFETTRAIEVRRARNAIPLHPWGYRSHGAQDERLILPPGSTAAFLAVPADEDPALRAGDVIVLAELPSGGALHPRLGDPDHRQAVRLTRDPVTVPDALTDENSFGPGESAVQIRVLEIRWEAADALDRPLVVSEPGPDGRPVCRAVALANVVLADNGATILDEQLEQVQDGGVFDDVPPGPYRPRLDRPGIAFVDPVDPLTGAAAGASSAREAAVPRPVDARAALRLHGDARPWAVRPDLISSSSWDSHVVVETDDAGLAWLRYGDGVHGRRPPDGTLFSATYRIGAAAAGNVAAGTLTEPLLMPDTTSAFDDRIQVWNPLPATGGRHPESVQAVQSLAPQWIRRQERAVTTADHRENAERVQGVQRAVARRRWTGSWHTVEVTVDVAASRSGDPAVPRAVLDRLEVRRMAATDVGIRQPVWVPVHIRLDGCVAPGYFAGSVAGQVRELLSAGVLPDGRRGLFHPDHLTFGQPLYLSDIMVAAMQVPGISWIEVTVLNRLGGSPDENTSHLQSGVLKAQSREIIRCDSDPNLPEFGRVDVVMGGGT